MCCCHTGRRLFLSAARCRRIDPRISGTLCQGGTLAFWGVCNAQGPSPNGAPEHPKPHRPSKRRRRDFLAEAFFGMVVFGVATLAWFWSHSMPARSAEDQSIYDTCLLERNGNTVACDAEMRLLARERTAEAAMLQQAAKLVAAGFSGCEMERWTVDAGFVGSQLSRASGIPLSDLQAGKYNSTEPSSKGAPAGSR